MDRYNDMTSGKSGLNWFIIIEFDHCGLMNIDFVLIISPPMAARTKCVMYEAWRNLYPK